MKGVPLQKLFLNQVAPLFVCFPRLFLNFSFFWKLTSISLLMISIAVLIVSIVLCLFVNYKYSINK